MPKLQDFAIPIGATLKEAIGIIERAHSRTGAVMDGDKLVGVISEGDILRALLRGTSIHAQVNDFVRYSFKYLSSPDYREALRLAREHGIAMIPVVDAEFRLTDIITLQDILAAVELAPSR